MKNNKVLKAVSLSMALVFVGGATIAPIANVYAKEDGTETKAASSQKVKPSEKDIKTYEALKKAREKNMISVKAAKLLLELSPERVKDVKSTLETLIKDSEALVKKADSMIEKLEAKFEF